MANLDKFEGCILGVAVGDALGMPFETMTAEEIENILGKVLKSFHTAEINPHAFPEARKLHAGSWTDDTQLTLATMEALTESHGVLDMDLVAKKHIEAYEHTRGWGRATKKSVERLMGGCSWKDSGDENGSGNGVMMKIAPLGLLYGVREVESSSKSVDFVKDTLDFAMMTHRTSSAVVAGSLHALAIRRLSAGGERTFFGPFLNELIDFAVYLERNLQKPHMSFSGLLRRIKDMKESRLLDKEDHFSLSRRFGGGTRAAFSAYNTFGLAYATFLRNPNDFECVFNAVKAGGDTDSYAAIVGSLIGALHGVKVIPEYLLKHVEARDEIIEKTKKFFEACSGS